MGDFTLVKFSGKPIEKLIDVIASSIGIIYEPTRIKRKADAKAYKFLKLEDAKIQARLARKALTENPPASDLNLSHMENLEEIIHRAKMRNAYEQIQQQLNLDSINYLAADELNQDQIISDEPVSGDWSTRFFNYAKEISTEEMQLIWGKILAGEVRKPGSFSLRTLEVLRTFSKKEAEIFQKLVKISFKDSDFGSVFLLNINYYKELAHEIELNVMEYKIMEEYGILHDELVYKIPPGNGIYYFINGMKLIRVKSNKLNTMAFKVSIFTLVGEELMQLLPRKGNDKAIERFKSTLHLNKVDVVNIHSFVPKLNHDKWPN